MYFPRTVTTPTSDAHVFCVCIRESDRFTQPASECVDNACFCDNNVFRMKNSHTHEHSHSTQRSTLCAYLLNVWYLNARRCVAPGLGAPAHGFKWICM